MSLLASLRERLGRTPPDAAPPHALRDGQADMLQAEALQVGVHEAARIAHRTISDGPRGLLMASIGQKVLGAYMANRHQTLFPLAVNFRRLDAQRSALLMQILAAALHAGGPEEPARRLPVIRSWMRSHGGDDALADSLTAAIAAPRPLPVLLAEAAEAGLQPYAFAMALAALDQRQRASRMFLDYLAARLDIPGDVARSLSQRFRA